MRIHTLERAYPIKLRPATNRPPLTSANIPYGVTNRSPEFYQSPQLPSWKRTTLTNSAFRSTKPCLQQRKLFLDFSYFAKMFGHISTGVDETLVVLGIVLSAVSEFKEAHGGCEAEDVGELEHHSGNPCEQDGELSGTSEDVGIFVETSSCGFVDICWLIFRVAWRQETCGFSKRSHSELSRVKLRMELQRERCK